MRGSDESQLLLAGTSGVSLSQNCPASTFSNRVARYRMPHSSPSSSLPGPPRPAHVLPSRELLQQVLGLKPPRLLGAQEIGIEVLDGPGQQRLAVLPGVVPVVGDAQAHVEGHDPQGLAAFRQRGDRGPSDRDAQSHQDDAEPLHVSPPPG